MSKRIGEPVSRLLGIVTTPSAVGPLTRTSSDDGCGRSDAST